MPSENGWEPAWVGEDRLEWVTIPGCDPPVKLQIQKGLPLQILRAFVADYNAYVEPVRDADCACYTPTNSVSTSNHLNGTAVDIRWDSHPFHVKGTFGAKLPALRDLLNFYKGVIFWGGDWQNPIDEMHFNLDYNSYNNPATAEFVRTKIRPDGFSTYRRDKTDKPSVPAAVLASAVTATSTNGTEKVLTYPRDQQHVAQETGYWCGPASTQNVLACRGITVSERELADQMGTTESGTNYIGQVQKVLDKYLPDAKYTVVDLPNDPATPAQREKFWADLVASIDSGYGIVMNWVSPASNPPIAIKGSESPVGYGRHTVWHYLAACGYDSAARAVWVVDSGFRPFQYWLSLEQCVSLMPPKGYCYAAAAPRPATLAAAVTPIADHGVDVLAEVMGNALPKDRYAQLLPAVEACLVQCECNTVERIAMWAAQIGHESGGLQWMEELADGSAYEGRSDLGNDQPGFGQRYKGRGPIQVTGFRNYSVLSAWAFKQGLVSSPTYFVDRPGDLASDKYGFVGVTWYWTTQRKLNEASDAKNLEQATRMVNGGLNGLADRRSRYEHALAMGDRLLALVQQPAQQPALLQQEAKVAGGYESRSGYRNPNEGSIGGLDQFTLSDDGMLHVLFVEISATQLGDTESIYRVIRSAAGRGADTSHEFVKRARSVLGKVPRDALADTLARIERTDPALLTALTERVA